MNFTAQQLEAAKEIRCSCGGKCEGTCSEEHLLKTRKGVVNTPCPEAFPFYKKREKKDGTRNDY